MDSSRRSDGRGTPAAGRIATRLGVIGLLIAAPRRLPRLCAIRPYDGDRRIRQGRPQSQRPRRRLQHRLPEREPPPLPRHRIKSLGPEHLASRHRDSARRGLPVQPGSRHRLRRPAHGRRQQRRRLQKQHLRRSLEQQHLRLQRSRRGAQFALAGQRRRRNLRRRGQQHGRSLRRHLRRRENHPISPSGSSAGSISPGLGSNCKVAIDQSNNDLYVVKYNGNSVVKTRRPQAATPPNAISPRLTATPSSPSTGRKNGSTCRSAGRSKPMTRKPRRWSRRSTSRAARATRWPSTKRTTRSSSSPKTRSRKFRGRTSPKRPPANRRGTRGVAGTVEPDGGRQRHRMLLRIPQSVGRDVPAGQQTGLRTAHAALHGQPGGHRDPPRSGRRDGIQIPAGRQERQLRRDRRRRREIDHPAQRQRAVHRRRRGGDPDERGTQSVLRRQRRRNQILLRVVHVRRLFRLHEPERRASRESSVTGFPRRPFSPSRNSSLTPRRPITTGSWPKTAWASARARTKPSKRFPRSRVWSPKRHRGRAQNRDAERLLPRRWHTDVVLLQIRENDLLRQRDAGRAGFPANRGPTPLPAQHHGSRARDRVSLPGRRDKRPRDHRRRRTSRSPKQSQRSPESITKPAIELSTRTTSP